LAVGAKDEDTRARHLRRRDLEQPKRTGIGPVQVIQNYEQPVGLSGLMQDRHNRFEEYEVAGTGLVLREIGKMDAFDRPGQCG